MRTCLATLAVLAMTTAARADAPPPRPVETTAPATIEVNYGYQLIIGEFAGLTLVGLTASSRSGPAVAAAAGVWALGVPAIHAAHGNPGRTVASLALRGGLMAAGFELGGNIGCEHVSEHSHCRLGRALAGAAIGYGVAAIVDAVFLARARRDRPARTWSPTVSAAPGRVSLGVVGAF